MNMKKMFLGAAAALAASACGSLFAAAEGDIFEIRPCLRDGTATNEYATASSPMDSGRKLYFNMRLYARVPGDTNTYWRLEHIGASDEIVDDVHFPLQIGIYVSGRLTYATLVETVSRGDFTDFIFEYVTQPGDFAMPITLATESGPATETEDGSAYLLNPARTGKWKISNIRGDECNLLYYSYSSTGERPSSASPDGERITDYSLRKCGFYVQTVDFDAVYADASGTPAVWRTVHEGSTIANPASPKLAAAAPLAESTTLYVWSMNGDAVEIEGGADTVITTNYVGGAAQTATVKMGTVTMAGGATSADFSIRGKVNGGAADLVLSAWPGFRFDGDRHILDDEYVTRRVRCIEPLPASVVVEADRVTAVADSDYLVCKARLSVYVTQPYNDGPIEVTVTPSFEDGHTGGWGDYVRFSTTSESVQTLPSASAAPKVTIPAGSTDKRYIYVYAIRGDEHTEGVGKQMKFTPEIDPAVQAAAGISSLEAAGLNISAAEPVVTNPTSSTEGLELIAGDEIEIPVRVSDTYADMTDTNTGYKVEIKRDGSSSWEPLAERFAASGKDGALVGLKSGAAPKVKYPTAGVKASQVRVTAPVSGKTSEAALFTVTVKMPTTSWCETTDDKDDTYTEGDTVKFKISLSEGHGNDSGIYAFLLCNEDVDVSMFGGNPCIVTNENVAQSGTTGRPMSKTATSATGSFSVLDGASDDDGGSTYSFSVLLCKTKSWDPKQIVKGFTTTEMINILVYNKEPVFDTTEPVSVNGFTVENDGATLGSQMPKGQVQRIQPQFNDVSYDLKHGFEYKWTASCNGQSIANGTVSHADTNETYAVTNKTGGTVSIKKYVPSGTNINTVPIEYAFGKAGLWTIKIQMRDKDMTTWAKTSFSFNVEVIDNPQVSITVDDLYYENASRAFIHVGLGGYYTADDPVVVKLTVSVPEADAGNNRGIFTLDGAYKTIPAKPADQASPYPDLYASTYSNEYYVVFNDALEQDILISEMDGTDATARRGVLIHAEVVTKTVSTDPDKNWDEYYLANQQRAYVMNTAPVCNMQTENTNAWVVSGGYATSYPIRWGVQSDVPADFTNEWTYSNTIVSNGVRVTIMGCVNEETFYVTNSTSGRFVPNFGTEQGEKTVTFMIEDKDGDYVTYAYHYMVVASKFITTVATGPSHGTTSSKLSQKYSLATGVGQGHTWVGDGALFMEAADFRLKWNCSRRNDVDIYAFGYKTKAPLDNGSLDMAGTVKRDIAIDKRGYATADVAIADADCYFYNVATNETASQRRDSFFYLWMQHTVGEDGKYASEVMGDSPAPERPGGAGTAAGVVGVANAALPRSMEEDGSYVNTLVEAVFAKEWRVADNLGDINFDGVPDAFAIRTWGGGNLIEMLVKSEQTAADGENAAASADIDILDYDLRSLASFNAANDFLPQVATDSGAVDFGGGRSSYAPIGIPFTTRMQLRGFHSGLNAVDITVSDADFSKEERRAWSAYTGEAWTDTTKPDLTKWSPEPGTGGVNAYAVEIDKDRYPDYPYDEIVYAVTTNSTERQFFYTEDMDQIPADLDTKGGMLFVSVANQETGVEETQLHVNINGTVTNIAYAARLTNISLPDFPRMDPTMLDTDGDGFPDGWEYFFWYLAHVEYPANGDRYRRPGQVHLFERFNRANILEGSQISASAVEARFNPCQTLSARTLRRAPDFDGDGLADMEELAIGTNPCHWDSDGDKMCDGWEVMMCLDPLHYSKDVASADWNPDADFMAYHDVATDLVYLEEVTPAVPEVPATEDDPGSPAIPATYRYYIVTDTLVAGVDYDPDSLALLRDMEVKAVGFSDAGRVYGHAGDSGYWGRPMVDDIVKTNISLVAHVDKLETGLPYILIHNQVRLAFDFDPRTGWHVTDNGYVADRWDPSRNAAVAAGDMTGIAVNTREYTSYDEYLLAMYRTLLGIPSAVPRPNDTWLWLRYMTTNPSAVTKVETETTADDEGNETTVAITNITQAAQALADALHAAGSSRTPVTTHGADTDLDGVPDGWELYMTRDPNHAPGAAEDGLGLPRARDFDGDGLSFADEYAGTDSCNVYSGCASIYARRPGARSGWYNKFFPTNPGTVIEYDFGEEVEYENAAGGEFDLGGELPASVELASDGYDTDGDGISDGAEGSTWGKDNTGLFFHDGIVSRVTFGFIYGDAADDGTTCIRGGGMNPCTVDTDQDGLPDGWEMQHAGIVVDLGSRSATPPRGSTREMRVNISDSTWAADGLLSGGATSGEYIQGGMDATWPGDAVTDIENAGTLGRSYDSRLGTTRDVDFDHDGLQNWQEYLVQTLRHLRYDDISTPLMGREMSVFENDKYVDSSMLRQHRQTFFGFVTMDAGDPEALSVNAAEAWGLGEYVKTVTVTNGTSVVVDDVGGGQLVTNVIYYTTEKKILTDGESIVHEHVNAVSKFFQRPWTVDGWRELGYFAPAARYWDRSNVNNRGYTYLMPVTGEVTGGVAGYVSTDPRMSDTDGDGMDDYWELFHGLNPILGTDATDPADSDVALNGKHGDIISATYQEAAGAPTMATFNAFFNEWIYPDYNSVAGRLAGMQPTGNDPASGAIGDDWEPRRTSIDAPEAYDPVLYPWIMGVPLADADGDGLRNEEESLLANVADPVPSHTDPSPLWFTDRTTEAGYVAQYYVDATGLARLPFWPHVVGLNYIWATMGADGDYLHTFMGNTKTYSFSFEENEGYDTDNDFLPDGREIIKTVRLPTDPLRFEDPDRRQALYLDGVNSFAMSYNPQIRVGNAEDFLKQFTVECWVRPEGLNGKAQTIIDRCAAYEGDAITKDQYAIRSNFRIGVSEDGRVYGMFDNTDSIESGLNMPVSCQRVDGRLLHEGEWTHVALTYDGAVLKLYVNGNLDDAANTTLIPANGVFHAAQDVTNPARFPTDVYSALPCAFFVGARPQKQNLYALFPYYIDPATGEHKESFDNLREYFHGYVDEVRVWDGAKTGAEIRENFMKRMSHEDVLANRATVYTAWNNGATRNNNDGRPVLPVELALHFNFVTLPGAVHAEGSATSPVGFRKSVLGQAGLVDGYLAYIDNEDVDLSGLYPNLLELKTATGIEGAVGDEHSLEAGWWKNCLIHNSVYNDYNVVPWIENSVTHLPILDGRAGDSFYYSETLGGLYTPSFVHNIAKFVFPNSGMPYQGYNAGYDRYHRLFAYERLVEQRGDAFAPLLSQFRFMLLTHFLGTSDLIPLGGAYAKTCPELWDSTVADAWEVSGDDGDGDGLPDWWEDYARANYAAGVLDLEDELLWDSVLNYHGLLLPAYQAFWVDLYRGLVWNGTSAYFDSAYAASTDRNENNIPDWWEDLFGVTGMDVASDPDNDGLSIFEEYTASFGNAPYGLDNGFPLLDPLKTRSGKDQRITDYFLQGPATNIVSGAVTNVYGSQYIGEIMGDHDFMENWWENLFPGSYASSYVHDPALDRDGDGWSNWAETRSALWGGTYVADLIDRFSESGIHQALYPKPAIGLTVTYFGKAAVDGARLVVRTSNGKSERMDAKFVVAPGLLSAVRHIGMMNPGSVMRGFMSPGSVVATSVVFSRLPVYSSDTYGWDWGWYLTNGYTSVASGLTDTGDAATYRYFKLKYPNIALKTAENGDTWESFASAIPDALGMTAKIVHNATDAEIGSIDLRTGEWALDTTALEAAESGRYDLSTSMMRVEYSTQQPSGWPKTFWLCDTGAYEGDTVAGEGAVREGLNYIEAFLDLNNDGAYTAGEPFGAVRNVNVSWHKTAEIKLELTETTPVVPRYNIAAGTADRIAVNGSSSGVSLAGNGAALANAGTAKFSISRKSINGTVGRQRKIFSRDYLVSDRAYVTEGDVISETLGRFDLDWNYLVGDSKEVLKDGEVVANVVYSLKLTTIADDGTESTTEVGTFLRTFNAVRPAISPVYPAQGASVRSATPEFSFTCSGDDATAFRMQIIDPEDGSIAWDSGVKALPGRTDEAVGTSCRRYTAPLYVGMTAADGTALPLKDGKAYKWRLAAFNAAFPDSTLAESDWSETADFVIDIASAVSKPELMTGYGSVAAAVRYYGPSTNKLENSIIVEAHRSADFSDAPVGKTRISDTGLVRSEDDITTTNAVMHGIAAGDVYLLAFIDINTNGVRDVWEPWGYANKVGSTSADIYTPVAVSVLDSHTVVHSATVFMEDCDRNRNNLVDGFEPENFPADALDSGEDVGPDADRDGLPALYESELGTNPNNWDTDGDGMPDGWEYTFANGLLDPLNADGDLVSRTADPMAYAEISARVVTLRDTNTNERAKYVLPDWEGMAGATMYRPNVAGVKTPAVGEDMAGKNLWTTYEYGDRLGLGRLVAAAAPSGGAYLVDEVGTETVVLVHAQVYDWFGYDARTASASGEAVNTKTMTALDKYLVVRYLEAIGLKDVSEDTVNTGRLWSACTLMPGESDYDRDGIADGWELYVMFGTNTCASATAKTVADLAVSPWNYGDARKTAPGAGSSLTLLEEFDRGLAPTDPWQLDSDRDGILDKEAYKYQVKTAQSQLSDLDRDGLSNWAEYLAYKKAAKEFKVDDAFSATSNRLDYFETLMVGGLRYYIGESMDADGKGLIADHDFVDDAWEDMIGLVRANRYVYDALRDADGNGWSNWAENRAAYDEATWVQTGTRAVERTATFDVGSAAQQQFAATNAAAVAATEYYHADSGVWNADAEGAAQVRYTLSVEEPVMGYGGRPVPWVELEVKGLMSDDEASGCTLTVYRDIALSDVVAVYDNLDLKPAKDGTARVRFRGEGLVEGPLAFVLKSEFKNGSEGEGVMKAGFARAVNVGYSKVELSISLSTSAFLFKVDGGAEGKTSIRIIRSSLNDKPTSRTVYSRKINIASGKFFSLADFTLLPGEVATIPNFAAEYDADWKYLVGDAATLGFAQNEISNAVYKVFVGDELHHEITRSFDPAGSAPVPELPKDASYYRVLEARPTFSWKMAEEYPAFALEIAKDEDFTEVVHSETNAVPAKNREGIVTYSPEVYVGRELEDGKTYFWRVAQLNAKFTTNVWSEAAKFFTAVNVDNADTGYGRIGAEVRYYGPATNGNLVVGVYKAGDFAAAPVASKVLANDLQAITNDLARPFAEVATNAPAFVAFDGVAPGEYYVMAFVDANTNGVRDVYETWGYANRICDSLAESPWQPASTNVVSTKAELPAMLVVMEDTDVNQNNLPDCMDDTFTNGYQNAVAVNRVDSDRDGLSDDEEDGVSGTDYKQWDTDGDGMPDGWEYIFSGGAVDANKPDAAIFMTTADLMAYAEIDVRTVTLKDTETLKQTEFILPDDMALPQRGDDMTSTNLYSVYQYGDALGLGRLVKVVPSSDTAFCRVESVNESAKAVLVHAQVYDRFGFSSKTCVPGDNAVNTRLMTAIDKYLVVRYLEAIGLKGMSEDMVNTGRLWNAYTLMPKSHDFDCDGIPDGWELYTMFGTNTCAAATNFTMNTLKISPWKYDDARALSPSGLDLLDEYDRGIAPTDPWQNDSDGDGILDKYAFEYHLKGNEALADADGDGLSNYAEYLLTEVFALTDPNTGASLVFDPDDAYSVDPNRRDTDYFYRGAFGELYAGEIFADHDLVEDYLEDRWGLSYSSRYQWDADKDKDEDKWSLFAEARYNRHTGTIFAQRVSHIVGETEMRDAPKPSLDLVLRYNGEQNISGANLVVKTYTPRPTQIVKEDLDATFIVTPGQKQENISYIGDWGRRTVRGILAPGYIVPETFEIEFAQYSKADSYTVRITGMADKDAQLGERYPDGVYKLDYVTYVTLVGKFGRDTVTLLSDVADWSRFGEENAISLTYDDNRENGYICLFGERVGTVNLLTGSYALDLEPFGAQMVDRLGTGDDGTESRTSLEQATFRIVYESLVPALHTRKLAVQVNNPASGWMKEGLSTVTAFYDLDNNGEYTPGEPMAVANNVNIGWYGGFADMELTDTCPVFTRIEFDSQNTDRKTIFGGNDFDENIGGGTTTSPVGSRFERMRIVRYGFEFVWTNANGEVTGLYTMDANNGKLNQTNEIRRPIVDKWIDFNKTVGITEKDILSSGTFDIDWDGLCDELRTNSTLVSVLKEYPKNGLDLRRAKYAIYFGDTNAVHYPLLSCRRFDDGSLRQKPTAVSPGRDNQIVYTPWPEFKWHMSSNDTYTAFQVEILSTSSNSIWKSGVRRVTPRDSEGLYSFRPDLFVGDGYTNDSNYLWRVSMYNSKFKEDLWSEPVNFRLNVVDSGYTYGKIPVSVRYFGPKNALANGVIKVEAHRKPDFTDVAEARYIVTNVADVQSFGSEHRANVVLKGLEKGEYFICAWIDLTNGCGTVNSRDSFESWGYAAAREADPENAFSPVAVTVGVADGQSETARVYIEDNDTNQNNIPDIYEMIVNGGSLDSGATNVNSTIAGDIAISTALAGNLKALGGNKEADNGLQTTVTTALKTRSFAAMMMGVRPSDLNVGSDGSITVEQEVEGVEITSIGFDGNGNIAITIDAELSSPSAASAFYEVNIPDTVSVNCKVYRKETLAESEWTLVSETRVAVGGGECVIDAGAAASGGQSGFYKVVVEK